MGALLRKCETKWPENFQEIQNERWEIPGRRPLPPSSAVLGVTYQAQLRVNDTTMYAQLRLYSRLIRFAIAITNQAHGHAIACRRLSRNCDRYSVSQLRYMQPPVASAKRWTTVAVHYLIVVQAKGLTGLHMPVDCAYMNPLRNRNCEVNEPANEKQLFMWDVPYQTQLRLHRGSV